MGTILILLAFAEPLWVYELPDSEGLSEKFDQQTTKDELCFGMHRSLRWWFNRNPKQRCRGPVGYRCRK